LAQLSLAYLGLAWPGSWPQAGPSTSLLSAGSEYSECDVGGLVSGER
jgi:hypothetical protein